GHEEHGGALVQRRALAPRVARDLDRRRLAAERVAASRRRDRLRAEVGGPRCRGGARRRLHLGAMGRAHACGAALARERLVSVGLDAWALRFGLVLSRVSGVAFGLPMLADVVPARLRVAFGLVLSLVISTALGPLSGASPSLSQIVVALVT